MQQEVTYGEAIVQKFPEQIVIGIATDGKGMANPITLGWTMITSHQPPMMAVSIGLGRYSLEVFRAADAFVIAMPAESQADETMLFGTKSGRDMDKFAAAGTALQPASKIDGVLMAEAVANFECRKTAELTTGDHVIFVGEIVCSHMNPDCPSRLYTVGEGFKMGGLARI
jgi:flavin reductase (DIM6/NTAB) family NADH-FMN oxidoreductase RutF